MVTFSEQSAQSTAAARSSSKPNKNGNKLFKIALIVVAAVVALGSGYFFLKNRGVGISTGDYHAVFLTNNQVYFGKIAKSNSSEVVLTDVYYMIVRRPLQAQVPSGSPSARPRPEYTLIKLGGELHGPEDEMRINREHILFIEALKKDGKVVQAIAQSKNKPQK